MPKSRRSSLAAGLLATLASSGHAALAQDAPATVAQQTAPAPGAASADVVQDIIVTSERRSESIQKVPISVSAISGTDLQDRHIDSIEDLTRTVPGVTFNAGATPGLDVITIRGVSSTSGSSTIGVYLDDVSIGVPNLFGDGFIEPQLFDLDRVEVLRGPQGTLYGASSEGGTIRYITRPPNMDNFEAETLGKFSGTVHGGFNHEEAGTASIPIIPGTFSIRATVEYQDDSGYIDNYNYFNNSELLHNGVNSDHYIVAHITGKYVVDDDTILTPALFVQRFKADDNSAFYPSGVTSTSLVYPPVQGLWKQSKQVDEFSRDDVVVPSLTVNRDLGFADLTSVSGYFFRDAQREQDGTYYNSQIFATAFLDPLYPQFQPQNDALIGTLRSPVQTQTTYQQVSQEIRLSSHPYENLPLRWVTGVYYSDLSMHDHVFQLIPGINRTFQNIYGFPLSQSLAVPAYGQGVTDLFPGDSDEAVENDYDVRQYSIFGQVDVDILPNLHFAAGGRYLIGRSAVNFTSYGFYEIGQPVPFDKSQQNYAFTPKFSLTYDVAEQNNVYASISKGFRLGGPQVGPTPFGPTSVCAQDFKNLGVTSDPLSFGSDKLWTYELGSKNRFDDGRVTINGAFYYTQWYNVQQQIPLPICGYAYTANIGNAEIYGGELEVTYRPVTGLTLGFSGSTQHAVVTSSNNPQTAAVGEHLVNVPEENFDIFGGYEHQIDDESSFYLNTDWSYNGPSNGSYLTYNSNYKNPAYQNVNASFGYRRGRYDVSVFGTNVTNDRNVLQRPQLNTVIEGYTLRPTTFGVQLRVTL
jgi:outer membrane receptor protein involved in Fe transport